MGTVRTESVQLTKVIDILLRFRATDVNTSISTFYKELHIYTLTGNVNNKNILRSMKGT